MRNLRFSANCNRSYYRCNPRFLAWLIGILLVVSSANMLLISAFRFTHTSSSVAFSANNLRKVYLIPSYMRSSHHFNYCSQSQALQPSRRLSSKSWKRSASASDSAPPAPAVSAAVEDVRAVRLGKLNSLIAQGCNPYAYKFDRTHKSSELHEEYKNLPNGEEAPLKPDNSIVAPSSHVKLISVAGRVMIKRSFGKLAFFSLQDDMGSIQLYLDKGKLHDEFSRLLELTDPGDIIGVKGSMKRTDKGELSVNVQEWQMLSKALAPLPDKYHGLQDTNKRYRQRHLDMVVNASVRHTLQTRAKIISSIRQMLDDDGYTEIETPILNNQPGGADARPFLTYHNSLDMPLTLRIATELHLKRMLVGGFDRVYEIGRIFRNEGISTRHNPEFTSIELYEAYSDYHDMMHRTEQMISTIARKLSGENQSCVVPYQSHGEIDLTPPWRRVTMTDIVKENTGVDFSIFMETGDLDAAKKALKSSSSSCSSNSSDSGTTSSVQNATLFFKEVEKATSVGTLLNIAFEHFCEHKLIQPTFVLDYPVEISPLSKPHRSKKGLVERFELFVVGRELANAFTELTDPREQRLRFEKQAEKAAAGDLEATAEIDEDFIHALEIGCPPAGGLGIGIDRLVMLLTNAASIRDVLAFPLMKKESNSSSSSPSFIDANSTTTKS